jgi:acyl-CoA thioesterase-1|tara:strand:+ start:125 stop:802 length:678 start_codon:yes stop_codon:yes gene_type:complete
MGTRFWRLSHLIIQHFLYCHIRNSLAIGCLLLALTGQAFANETKILVLGDSISAAYGMSLEQGWVTKLAVYLKERDAGIQVVNASISGETTAGGLRRLPLLLQENQPSMVIIELGANDGLRGYPLNTLYDHLKRLVEMAQQAGAKVILLPMEIPPNYGTRYTSGFRESFRQVALETDCTLAPFILDGVATNPALMQGDGIHPTVEAQPLLLDNVLPTVIAVLDKS